MNLRFADKRIAGVLAVVPAREMHFADEMASFGQPPERSKKLAEVMGYDKRRIVYPEVTVSSLVCRGIEHLVERGLLRRTDIDALILVTQTPDRLMPPTSNLVQARLGLKRSMICLDVNQGCAGFVIGLTQAFALLEQKEVRKVVLVNADVMSRRTSQNDRNSWPLIGDAAGVTVVERGPACDIHANVFMDGSRGMALTIPAGGMEIPSSPATATLCGDGHGNSRAPDHLVMDGTAVFQFVMTEVPPMIERLLGAARVSKEFVDAFFFHQPNRFMLDKLAEKLGVPKWKMPSNVVEKYGNSSGATIPVAITTTLDRENVSMRTCFAGFGVGLTWASLLMPLGALDFCELIDYP